MFTTRLPILALVMASIQIKRKRGQDPLDALMLQDKKTAGGLIFRLAGTFDSAIPDGTQNITLQETGENRTFKRRKHEKPATKESEDLDPLLKEMVSEYIDGETEDYVYDVYFGSTSSKQVSGAIGYIVLDEDDKLLFEQEEQDDSDAKFTDDEDSNAEDFYRNDYPDEDSELSLDEFEQLALSDDDNEESESWSD